MGLKAICTGLAAGMLMATAAQAQDAAGDWDGALNAGAGLKLRLAFHIAHGAPGLSATLDSLDQGAFGIPASLTVQDGHKVKIEIVKIGAAFDGTLSGDGATLSGDFSQGGRLTPLMLTRRAAGGAGPAVARPQTPHPPYPYREEEVAYRSMAGVRLAGTLTLPKGAGPFPAVALIAGSGPNRRDEDVFGHKIFLVLADRLTRNGIAVLRYDKRGLGKSTGDYKAATSQDFAADAEASAVYLRGRPEIDARHVGLIGHSEGGAIAPMVAADDPHIAFIVLMAGPGLRGDTLLLKQQQLIGRALGVPDEKLAEGAAINRRLYAAVESAKDGPEAAAKAHAVLADTGMSAQAADAAVAQVSSNWMRFFLAYDPAPTLSRVKCPVLAINGSKDLQVPPAEDLSAIKAALATNPDVQTVELEGLNHLFQTASTGAPSEYAEIEETISPRALDLIASWIERRAP
jgi:pimeloyl-ACP methyl ester carboxylesterase